MVFKLAPLLLTDNEVCGVNNILAWILRDSVEWINLSDKLDKMKQYASFN